MSRNTIKRVLTGIQFGKLTAIEYSGTDKNRNALWKCKCSCGNEIIVQGTLLVKGKVISCGVCEKKYERVHPKEIEVDTSFIDQRFGKLIVKEEYSKTKYEQTRKYCKCLCDCGKIFETEKSKLNNGKIKDCGCGKKERMHNNLYKLKTDRIGKHIGLLKVLEFDLDKKKWKCQCECGNIIYVRRLCKNTRSCGCLKTMKKQEKENAYKRIEEYKKQDEEN